MVELFRQQTIGESFSGKRVQLCRRNHSVEGQSWGETVGVGSGESDRGDLATCILT